MPRIEKGKRRSLKTAKKLGTIQPLFTAVSVGSHIQDGTIVVRKSGASE
jgi:hypothetical protein